MGCGGADRAGMNLDAGGLFIAARDGEGFPGCPDRGGREVAPRPADLAAQAALKRMLMKLAALYNPPR